MNVHTEITIDRIVRDVRKAVAGAYDQSVIDLVNDSIPDFRETLHHMYNDPPEVEEILEFTKFLVMVTDVGSGVIGVLNDVFDNPPPDIDPDTEGAVWALIYELIKSGEHVDAVMAAMLRMGKGRMELWRSVADEMFAKSRGEETAAIVVFAGKKPEPRDGQDGFYSIGAMIPVRIPTPDYLLGRGRRVPSLN